MKKRLKNINKFKLSLNNRQIWFFFNLNHLNKKHQQIQLKMYDQVHQLDSFYNRSLNILIRFLFFQSLFLLEKKKKIYKQIKKKIYFFLFFKIKRNIFFNYLLKREFKLYAQKLKKKKLKFLSTILHIFSFFNFNTFFIKKNTFNFLCYCNINAASHSLLNFYKCISFRKKQNKKQIFQDNKAEFDRLTFSKLDMRLSLKFQQENRILKQTIQFLFLLKIKFLFEKILTKLFNVNTIIFFQSALVVEELHLLDIQGDYSELKKEYSIYKIPYSIKKLNNIKEQLLFSFMAGFFYQNPQLIVEQIAYSLHRIRLHFPFFKWIYSQIENYVFNSTDIYALKLIICGKIGAKTRTKFECFATSDALMKDQTFALKVDYGYISAETFTGTFGLHLWFYRYDFNFLFPEHFFSSI